MSGARRFAGRRLELSWTRERLNHFLCFGLGHLDHILQAFSMFTTSIVRTNRSATGHCRKPQPGRRRKYPLLRPI